MATSMYEKELVEHVLNRMFTVLINLAILKFIVGYFFLSGKQKRKSQEKSHNLLSRFCKSCNFDVMSIQLKLKSTCMGYFFFQVPFLFSNILVNFAMLSRQEAVNQL